MQWYFSKTFCNKTYKQTKKKWIDFDYLLQILYTYQEAK